MKEEGREADQHGEMSNPKGFFKSNSVTQK